MILTYFTGKVHEFRDWLDIMDVFGPDMVEWAE